MNSSDCFANLKYGVFDVLIVLPYLVYKILQYTFLCVSALQEKLSGTAAQNNPDINSSDENSTINKDVQPAKEERIRELNQQVDSLQNVIFQVKNSPSIENMQPITFALHVTVSKL